MTELPDAKKNLSDLTRRRFLSGTLNLGIGLAAERTAALAAEPVRTALEMPKPQEQDKSVNSKGNVLLIRRRVEARVHLNQVGFLPNEPKRAVVPATDAIHGNTFYIVDDDVTPEIRYKGELTEYETADGAKYGHFDRHFFADFDAFRRPGRYRLRLSDGRLSAPFSIGKNVYTRLVPLVLKYFDIQRCGKEHTGIRGPCHTDDGVIVGGPRDGQRMDAGGGWHDAGDYLKFVETTSYVTAVLLFGYDQYHHAFSSRRAHSGLPPMLECAKVGLDWLLKMHPSPEEFYYQVGSESDHDSWRLPEDDTPAHNAKWQPRPVYFGIGANLAGRTAAAFAIASRLYKPYDLEFAVRCLSAAQSVYRLGLKNRKIVTTKPADFYPEHTWEDDMEWAAADLYKATGNREYLEQALEFSKIAGAAGDQTSVYNTHALAHYTLYPHAPVQDKERLLGHLRSDAELTRKRAQNPYGLGTPYIWGTAEGAAGAAITCLIYAALSKDKSYHETARRQRDFILGCNPFSLSCVIGAGTRYPLFPHHQIANIRSIELSGAVVGGPASFAIFKKEKISMDNAEFSTQIAGPAADNDLPDEVGVYHDTVQDYVTNEPANDYTAKFLLMNAFYINGV